ncbi:molybdenum cofactor biosynthesis protein MoaE [Acinetobacter larvae]|nr:molybdenum cofactor biosynthesis protein MoaE [Acinetobacter larvae]
MQQHPRIQEQPLSLADFDAIQHYPECGGTSIFMGTVRNHQQGRRVIALKYTAYRPIAEKWIREIEDALKQKYAVSYIRVIHRIGVLEVGEYAIMAVVYAAHRQQAFRACEALITRVKHEVPIWKEEFYQDGDSQYVSGCCIRHD